MSMTPTTKEAKTAALVDWDRLNDLFAQMPAGPWDASRDTEGHEIRQIDTDPTNKHHWPFRLCRSVPGQRAACDDAVFDFIVGVLNAWPQIAAERSEEAEIKRILAMPEDELRKRCLVDGQSPEQTVRIADFAFECASLRAALIRISEQYVIQRGDMSDAEALGAIRRIVDQALLSRKEVSGQNVSLSNSQGWSANAEATDAEPASAALAAPRADSAESTAGEDDTLAAVIERRWTDLIGPAMDGGSLGRKRRDLCREFANAVREALTHPIQAGKLPLAATDFAEATWGDVWVENEIDSLREFATLSVPAPSSPGVPDSVREAVARLDEIRAEEAKSFQDGGGMRLYRIIPQQSHAETLALEYVRTLISAHPAGQSEDGAERCIACDKPLKAGERVLSDAEGGTIHTACCGPEREGYTKGDGEPLGPNDPIPQGYVYEPERPAGQSTGQGAGWTTPHPAPVSPQTEDAARRIAARRAGGAYADAASVSEAAWRSEIHAAEAALFGLPAPDSTRTGDEGTVAVPAKATREWAYAMALARQGQSDTPRCEPTSEREIQWAADRINEALAARPAAPEAQGAWVKVDVPVMRLSDGRADYYVRITCGDREVTPYKFADRYKAEYEAAHFAWVFGLRDEEPDLMAYDEASHPNEAPASSGQESAR